MSIITYPLNGVVYSAEDVATYLCTRTSGVYSKETNFAVSITGTRQITVAPGLAWINYDDFKGVSVCSREENVLTVPEADNTLNRVDRVVLQLDTSENITAIKLKTGTPAVAAQPPDILQNHNQYELGLCTISVPAGSTAVTAADITDTRADETVCGVMRDGVTGIPAATLIQRLRAEIDKVDKGSFYDKAEVDALLDELQRRVGASGQPVVVWSFGAGVDGYKTKTTTVAGNVDYLIASASYAGDTTVIVLRGKSVTLSKWKITFAQNGTLTMYYNDGGYNVPIYFTGYHCLTPSDGAKSPYIVDVLQNSYSNSSLTVDSSVDYIEADGRYIARGTPTGSSPSFSSEGAVKLCYSSYTQNGDSSIGFYPTTIILYHLITPEELNSKNVAAESAQADADALNLDQDYRLTLLELGVTDDETTETTV